MRSPDDETQARVGVDDTLAAHGLTPQWPPAETIRRPTLRRGLTALGDSTYMTGADEVGPRPDGDGEHGSPPARPLDVDDGDGSRPEAPLRIKGSLARGGMGWIRIADQRSLEREVVVKSLAPGRRGAVAADALLREARVTGLLDHPNIVPVHDVGWNDPDGPLIVMKRIEGASWHELIHDPDHPLWEGTGGSADARLERHLEILMDVCRAVHFAHSRGMVHRDIKPQNVMVGAYGEVYLLDWGVADVLDPERQTPAVVGTPAYMAPELVDPASPATERTDVYLLGAALHEVLTGRPRHDGPDTAAVMTLATLSAPHDYDPSVPAELASICNKACAADPADRFEDASDLRHALVEFLRHRGSVATARRALRGLDALEALVDGSSPDDEDVNLKVHASYSACRFGFEQALSEWPGNNVAVEGMQRCLRTMIRWELDADNHRSAALLLAELRDPAPELEARLARVQTAAAEREAAEAELAHLRREARIHGLNWGRTGVTLINGIISLALLVVTSSAIREGWIEPTKMMNLLFGGIITFLLLGGIVVFRRVLLDNRRYGQLMITLGLLGPLLVLNRLIALIADVPYEHLLVADTAIFCTIAATLAAVFDRAFWWSFLLAVVGTFLAFTAPGYTLDIVGATYLVHQLYVAWLVRPRPEPGAWSDGDARHPRQRTP